jgi:hypothetical protein
MKSRLLAFFLAGASLAAALASPAAAQPASLPAGADWLDAEVSVTFGSLSASAVEGTLAVHKVSYQGKPYAAQDLRAAHEQAERFGQGPMFLAALDAALGARAAQSLASMFPTANVTLDHAAVDPASLAAEGRDAYHPPVAFTFGATVRYSLQALGLASSALPLDDAKLQDAFELGVTASLPYNLTAKPGWNVSYAFALPSWLRFTSASGAALSADASVARWELANWLGPTDRVQPAVLSVGGRDAVLPDPSQPSDAHLDVSVDMRDVEGLTLPGLASGDFGRLAVTFDARLVMRSLRLADVPALESAVRARLPASLSVTHLSADGVRRAMGDGMLPPDASATMERYLQGFVAERVAGFGGDVADLHGEMSAEDASPEAPLVYQVGSTFHIPLGAREASRMQAAAGPVLFEKELRFALPRVNGLDTTYRVMLPPGIALQDVEAKGARSELGQQQGRDVVLLTPDSDDASATFTVAVTAEFVVAHFWYVWLGLVLVGASVVAVLLVRRARKRRPKPAKAAKPSAAAPAADPPPMPAGPPRAEPGAGKA